MYFPHCSLVWLVDIIDGNDSEIAVVAEVTKSNSSSWLDAHFINRLFGEVEANWHGEEVAIGEAVILDNAASFKSEHARNFTKTEGSEYCPYPL